MSERIRAHLRANVVGYIAIFLFATGGTAIALDGQNTVFSDDIVNGEVKSADILDEAVRSVDIQTRGVTGPDVANNTLGAVDIANNDGLGSPEIGGLTGGDIDESTLGQVPSATLGGVGRYSGNNFCDPEDLTFVPCGAVGFDLPGASRVLVIAHVSAHQDEPATAVGAVGQCKVVTSQGAVAQSTVHILADEQQGAAESATLTAVTEPIGPGVNFFGVECNQLDAPGTPEGINFNQNHVSAVALTGI